MLICKDFACKLRLNLKRRTFMSRIIIEAGTSFIAEDSVMGLLKGGFTAKTARVSYNLSNGLPREEDTNNYPLILEGTLGRAPVTIHVTSVTAGYGGTGPNTMVRLLKAAGFEFEESDILTDKMADSHDNVELTYTR